MQSVSSAREARLMQYLIASVFLTLGGWCVIAPASIIHLGIRPQYQTDALIALVAIGAFGAQAILAGLFAAFSIFTRRTFFIYGAALLPFFVFDWWFYAKVPLVNELMLIDVTGNLAMLAMCVRGYRALRPTPTTPLHAP
ncbi:MAG: hypothetical protein RIE56_02935 [Amphiplicatus sp.]